MHVVVVITTVLFLGLYIIKICINRIRNINVL